VTFELKSNYLDRPVLPHLLLLLLHSLLEEEASKLGLAAVAHRLTSTAQLRLD